MKASLGNGIVASLLEAERHIGATATARTDAERALARLPDWSEGGNGRSPPPPQGTDECAICGHGPAVAVDFAQATGWLVWRRLDRFSGSLCRACGGAMFRSTTNRSLIAGWWGIVALFTNALVLVQNFASRRRLAELAPPTSSGARGLVSRPLEPGDPLLARVGPWLSAVVVAGAVCAALAVAAAGSGTDPSGTQAPAQPAAAPAPAAVIGVDAPAQAAATGDAAEAAPTSTPAPPAPVGRQVLWTDLVPGDCFNSPTKSISRVEVIPCDVAHNHEVYANLDLTRYYDQFDSADFNLRGEGYCRQEFEPYVGSSFEHSSLRAGWWFGDDEAWARGERRLICIIEPPEGQPSMQQSARSSRL